MPQPWIMQRWVRLANRTYREIVIAEISNIYMMITFSLWNIMRKEMAIIPYNNRFSLYPPPAKT